MATATTIMATTITTTAIASCHKLHSSNAQTGRLTEALSFEDEFRADLAPTKFHCA
jgi:hypothetical protein